MNYEKAIHVVLFAHTFLYNLIYNCDPSVRMDVLGTPTVMATTATASTPVLLVSGNHFSIKKLTKEINIKHGFLTLTYSLF